jgi:membrane-bound serine protease (ClpP class)
MKKLWLLGVLLWTLVGHSESVLVPVLHVKDSINVGSAEHIRHGIEKARRVRAPALIVRLDTPGGLLEATRELVQSFLNTEDLKILVWVEPQGARAASAGSMISMAAHYAAMSPSTSIGAATPVTVGKEMAEDMKKKVTNDTLSFVEGIAVKRGRNVEWAKSSVSEAASLTANQALEKKVIDGIHENLADLWQGARKKYPELPPEVRFEDWEQNFQNRILSFLSNPNIAYGLMALGVLGIYAEMTHPGIIVPGAIGAISLALGAISLKILPIRPGALILLVVALLLLAIEIFLPVPTFGVAGVGGALALFLSGALLFDPEKGNFQLNFAYWIPAFILIALAMLYLGIVSTRALRSRGVQQGIDAIIGLSGPVLSTQGLRGQARFAGEVWNIAWNPALQENRPFELGEEVVVTSQEGFVAFVESKRV